jgi:two-component system sensor histidine kinase/response regulator
MKAEAAAKGIVLLVDDNPTNLGVLFDSLSDSGFKLLAAQDGESAIAQVNYLRPDIILLDVMMPGIDGFETCRRLKTNPATQDIPIIFMTALTETIDKVKGFSLGAVDYITKPFQTEEVLARIKTHLAIQHLQQQLQLQNQKLQQEIRDRKQAEQSLRVLLHAVSHDLRNPVTGMLMVLKNLLKTCACSEPTATEPSPTSAQSHPTLDPPRPISECQFSNPNVEAKNQSATLAVPRIILEQMVDSGDRQLNLINSLLEAHTIETQGITLHCEPLQLSDLIANVIQEVQPLLVKNRATLTSQIPAQLPVINGDANQLWRVLENLISNAIKHNPPGLLLEIEAIAQSQQIRCNVKDNGVGIPADQATQLFELYRRGANARHTHGLGLGLYLCQQIIRAHGGEIGVDSNPGQGSSFWFTLPLPYPTDANSGLEPQEQLVSMPAQ